MDTYTIAAAARLVGAPKGKLYEAIRTGRLQPTPTQASTSALTVTAVALQAVGFAVPASALPPPPTGLDTELSSPSGSRAAPPWPLPQGAPRGRLPRASAWVMDNLNTHWSLDVCRVVARWCKVPFEPDKLKKGVQRRAFLSDPSHHHVSHFTPMHGSWLNQAELFFGMLQRRFLARGSFSSIKDFERRLKCFLQGYNAPHAHPYRWTYTGEPLVRDTPFSRTRHQQRQGRACFSPRPKRFERLFYSLRPYRRQAA
jgi:DDE superfamily endonuclease